MSIGKLLRGGFWLSFASISSSLLGYLYWLLASRFVTPSVIGITVASLGYINILTSIMILGIPTGIQRFLGKSIGQENHQALGRYFYSSLACLVTLSLIVAFMLTLIGYFNQTFMGLTRIQLCFVVAMIALGFGSWTMLYNALFNSMLRTEVNALALIASAILKFTIGIALLYFGLELLGVILAFIIAAFALDIVYILSTRTFLPRMTFGISLDSLKESIHAGLASWIPNLITIISQWMGIIGLYALIGDLETGVYYMAFAIVMLIHSLPTSILRLMFPMLSGMKDGRKRATYCITRLSMVIVAPVSLALMAYPQLPLSMLGSAYLEATMPLRILLLGELIAPLILGFTNLIYAYGQYRYVTIIGFAGNALRIVLYPLLISAAAETGVAISYVSGLILALVVAIPISYKVGYKFPWLETLKAILPPLCMTLICFFLRMHWLVGVPLTLLSTLIYPKLGLITKADLAEASKALLSKQTVSRIYPYAKYVIELLYGE